MPPVVVSGAHLALTKLVQEALDGLGVEPALDGFDPLVKGLLRVAGKDRHLFLGQDRPVVHPLGGQVDGRAGDGDARGQSVPDGVPALEGGK